MAQKKDEFGRRRLQALLGKTARRGPHGRLQTSWYPNVHVPSAQSTHLNMTIKKEDKKKGRSKAKTAKFCQDSRTSICETRFKLLRKYNFFQEKKTGLHVSATGADTVRRTNSCNSWHLLHCRFRTRCAKQGDIAFSYSHEDLTVNRRHMEIQGSKESETIAKETLAQGTLTRTARKSRDHPRRDSACERGEQTSRRRKFNFKGGS